MSHLATYLASIDTDLKQSRRAKRAPVASSTEDVATAKPTKPRTMPKEKRRLIAWLEETYGELVVPEYRFHDTRLWRLDWAIDPVGLKIAIEFQGMFGGKAHRSIDNVMRDAEKMAEAQLLGWLYLQVNTASLRDGMAYRWIERAVEIRQNSQL